ncbi:tRNA pseudouridine(38-40) synthase TruA [Chloroflexota bacterium]
MTDKIVLVLEYDGTYYYGFQLQAAQPTVQGEVETALFRLTGEQTRVMAASRTDTGVHAREQVVSLRTGSSLPTTTFIGGLNFYLPRDIAVRAAYRVDGSFNARRDATRREYNYYILNSPTRSPIGERFTCHVAGRLDIEAMNEACRALIGRHDLASFTTSAGARLRDTVRTVYNANVSRDGETVIFNMAAGSFLTHQVRNTVGALIRVGSGGMSVRQFCDITEAKNPGTAGPMAPARGLFLMRVNYRRPIEEIARNASIERQCGELVLSS